MWDTVVGGLLVIVGVVLSLAGNLLIESLRWRREDEYRNYADRRHVYTEFLAIWSLYEEVKNTRFDDKAGEALEEARLQLLRSFNALSLLAPEEVRAAAHGVIEWSVEHEQEERDEDAPGRFWKAARKDLGIPD